MSHSLVPLFVLALLVGPCTQAGAQAQSDTTRRISVDEAVRLALEQNLGIAIERLNPQIQDVSIAQARSYWRPVVSSTLQNNSQHSPPTSALAGGQTKIVDTRFSTQLGVTQVLPTGASYSFAWNTARSTTTNLFTNFNPLLNSNVAFSFTQPLLRNRTIDAYRQQLEVSRKDRAAADVSLRATMASTSRNVKNAYWDLVSARDNLDAQQRSLDLSKRALADNEKRVQIGTMAPIDIVEAQAEVARNEEAAIVAEAAITQAEDRLRTLVFDPSNPEFWTQSIEPTEAMPFEPIEVDVQGAVRRAVENRTDVHLARTSLERSEVYLRYFRGQTLPEINANLSYQSNAVGGIFLSPLTSFPIDGSPVQRSVLSRSGYGSVIGDVFSNQFPTWTVGVTMSYPIGASTQEASLARARLQYQQAQRQLQNLELQIAAQVRDAARQVQTNQKRVDSARAARDLAEQRLAAEQKKFAAGIQISFFVFQAQRDLAQARTNEIKAIADYNKSIVDFEAIQETSLTGATTLTTAGAATSALGTTLVPGLTGTTSTTGGTGTTTGTAAR
ncbi:MAG: TolC family protein [Vicinamibacterales bacterium]